MGWIAGLRSLGVGATASPPLAAATLCRRSRLRLLLWLRCRWVTCPWSDGVVWRWNWPCLMFLFLLHRLHGLKAAWACGFPLVHEWHRSNLHRAKTLRLTMLLELVLVMVDGLKAVVGPATRPSTWG